MKLTEDQRQAVGEALTNKLAEMCPESDKGGSMPPDWFDSRNMDEVLDTIDAALVESEAALKPPEAPQPLHYWPYCGDCHQPFEFSHDEPFAHCKCGTTEWGDPRPAAWVPVPSGVIVNTPCSLQIELIEDQTVDPDLARFPLRG
jgi:hypothetical protein